MATSVFWLHGAHQQIVPPASHYYTMLASSSSSLRSFLSRMASWDDFVRLKNCPDSVALGTVTCFRDGDAPCPDRLPVTCFRDDDISHPSRDRPPTVTCFRDDDLPSRDRLPDQSGGVLGSRVEIRFSPWASAMLSGRAKESAGGPTGGGRGRGDGDDGGDGNGGGGGGDDDGGEEQLFLLPLLTIAFAAFHLGYCAAVWIKDEKPDYNFLRTGIALFCLLAISAVRINNRTGSDAYVLGLGASVGVMMWTGERCLVKKEGSPAGIVALFAACMAVMFTAVLYHSL